MDWTLVTGGARRLGAEICRVLSEQGHNIVVHYNKSRHDAESVAEHCRQQGVKADIIQGDFSTRESTLAFARSYQNRFPDTKNLINNVGNYLISPVLETSVDQWYEMFQNNLHVPFTLIQTLSSSIKKQQGCIINIGVVGIGNVHAENYCTAYSCAKMALLMLTKSVARELAPFHARANMVSPGYLDIAVDLPDDLKSLPMGRAAEPKEVARVVAFLLDSKSGYITGQNIEVAGSVRL